MRKLEVIEFLSGYSENAVLSVLEKLGYDADCDEYPEDIVEKAERIFASVNSAAALPTASENAIAVRETVAIASAELASVDLFLSEEVLFMLAREALAQSAKQANQIADLADAVLLQTLNNRADHRAALLAEAIASGNDQANKILNEGTMKRLVDAAAPPIPAFDLEKLEKEVREKEKDLARQNKARKISQSLAEVSSVVRPGVSHCVAENPSVVARGASSRTSSEFDIDVFLNEYGAPG
jgi:hypothetical protein